MPQTSSSQNLKRSLWPLAFSLVGVAAIVGIFWVYFLHRGFNVADRMLDWPEKAASRLAEMFQAKVSVSSNSFTLADKNIAELALVQRRIVCSTIYSRSWVGSRADVIVKGVYTVKAGYDLTKPYSITFNDKGEVLNASFPEPQVLSITTESQENYFVSEGTYNRLSPKDMEQAYAQNLKQARQEVTDLGLLKDTEAQLKQRLTDLMSGYGTKVVLTPTPSGKQ